MFRFKSLIIAFLAGLLVNVAQIAIAEDVPVLLDLAEDPCLGMVAPPSALDSVIGSVDPVVKLLTQGSIAVMLVLAAVTWLRGYFPNRFDPPGGATEQSRRDTMTAAGVIGLVLGLLTIAPAIPVFGVVLEGWRLLIARLLGGFLVATSAAFGRDWYTRSKGISEERKKEGVIG